MKKVPDTFSGSQSEHLVSGSFSFAGNTGLTAASILELTGKGVSPFALHSKSSILIRGAWAGGGLFALTTVSITVGYGYAQLIALDANNREYQHNLDAANDISMGNAHMKRRAPDKLIDWLQLYARSLNDTSNGLDVYRRYCVCDNE